MNYSEIFLLRSKFITFFIFSAQSAFFLFYSEIYRYYFYIIKILHILHIRFVCRIFYLVLIFKYVNYIAFFSINHHGIFGLLFQSGSLRQLKASLLIYNSTYRFWNWKQWKGSFILYPMLPLLLVSTILSMMILYLSLWL